MTLRGPGLRLLEGQSKLAQFAKSQKNSETGLEKLRFFLLPTDEADDSPKEKYGVHSQGRGDCMHT
jgi:hypothetical protein